MTNYQLQRFLRQFPDDLDVYIDLGHNDMSTISDIKREQEFKGRLIRHWILLVPVRRENDQ